MALTTTVRGINDRLYRVSMRNTKNGWEVSVREKDAIPALWSSNGMLYGEAQEDFYNLIITRLASIIAPPVH